MEKEKLPEQEARVPQKEDDTRTVLAAGRLRFPCNFARLKVDEKKQRKAKGAFHFCMASPDLLAELASAARKPRSFGRV